MHDSYRVTVSIVSHCNRVLLLECLAALDRSHNAPTFRVVVTDNASNDGSADAAEALFPDVQVLHNRLRAGFGANHNRVIESAETEFIFILNDDAVVCPQTLRILVDYLDKDQRVAAAGPRIVSTDGRIQQTAWRSLTPLSSLLFAATGGRRGWVQSSRSSAGKVGALSGCALLLRAEPLARAGAFDEDFFMYAEDLDVSRRLQEIGYEVHFVPEAEVTHHSQQSSAAVPDRRLNEQWRSLLLYLSKHHSAAGAGLARVALATGYAARAAVATVARSLPAPIRPERAEAWASERFGRSAWLALAGPPAGAGLREINDEFNHRVEAKGQPDVNRLPPSERAAAPS